MLVVSKFDRFSVFRIAPPNKFVETAWCDLLSQLDPRRVFTDQPHMHHVSFNSSPISSVAVFASLWVTCGAQLIVLPVPDCQC